MRSHTDTRPMWRPRCNVRGCPELGALMNLMCRHHWQQVPADLRRGVLDAYSAYHLDGGSAEDLTAAQAEAIASVKGGAR